MHKLRPHKTSAQLALRGHYQDSRPALKLSKRGSRNLKEDAPLENMSILHPDEGTSEQNEAGPLLSDDICIAPEICLPGSFRRRVKISTAFREPAASHLRNSRLG